MKTPVLLASLILSASSMSVYAMGPCQGGQAVQKAQGETESYVFDAPLQFVGTVAVHEGGGRQALFNVGTDGNGNALKGGGFISRIASSEGNQATLQIVEKRETGNPRVRWQLVGLHGEYGHAVAVAWFGACVDVKTP